MLRGRKILLGISGGIAAYKTPMLVRLLVKAGAEVQVVMTENARQFVSDLVLGTLSGRPALSAYIENEEEDAPSWNNHVELGLWPDLMLFAPLTAATLAKMVQGQSDNLLMAVFLSARCPIMLSPAMDLDMYQHPSTLRNMERAKEDGCIVIPAEEGELASGLSGQGRMPEPEQLFERVHEFFSKGSWSGKRVLINAGPTYEAIDPVRFIGNHSSGKMGLELARAAVQRGAEVDLVIGPSALEIGPDEGLRCHRVVSADEMKSRCEELFPDVDVALLSAAVSDYRPAHVSTSKIKKTQQQRELLLEPTPDILHELGRVKEHQLLVGFALETDDAEVHGRSKLERKNLDMIVVNQPSAQTGFGTDTNQALLLTSCGNRVKTELMSKSDLSSLILDQVEKLWQHA